MADSYTPKAVDGTPSSTIGTRIFIAPPPASGTDKQFVELTSITEVGDLGGDADDIDVTTLKQKERSYVPGVKDFPSVDVTLLMEDKDGTNDNYSILRTAEDSGSLYCVQVLFPNHRGVQFSAKIKTKLNGASINGALTFVASFYKKGDSSDITWSGTDTGAPTVPAAA